MGHILLACQHHRVGSLFIVPHRGLCLPWPQLRHPVSADALCRSTRHSFRRCAHCHNGAHATGSRRATPLRPYRLDADAVVLAVHPYLSVCIRSSSGLVAIGFRSVTFRLASVMPSLLCHVGLFIVLVCGTLGRPTCRRVKMYCEQGKPEWRALNELTRRGRTAAWPSNWNRSPSTNIRRKLMMVNMKMVCHVPQR
jgi:hypothetical protein